MPRVPLALTPTPMQDAPRLAKELGIGRLLIKRDDLTGLAFGGNKTRNLEFRMAEAVELGTEVFIAGLEAQSNSARQTTAAANILGMRSILVLRADRDWQWQGNPLVDRMLGAEVRWLETDDRATASAVMDRVCAIRPRKRRAGQRPYVMNHAGAFALGSALAYLLCTLEIVEQTRALGARSDPPLHGFGQQGPRRPDSRAEAARAGCRTVAISQRDGDDRVSGALAGARDAAGVARLGRAALRVRRRELRPVRRRRVRRAEPARPGRDAVWPPAPRGCCSIRSTPARRWPG